MRYVEATPAIMPRSKGMWYVVVTPANIPLYMRMPHAMSIGPANIPKYLRLRHAMGLGPADMPQSWGTPHAMGIDPANIPGYTRLPHAMGLDPASMPMSLRTLRVMVQKRVITVRPLVMPSVLVPMPASTCT